MIVIRELQLYFKTNRLQWPKISIVFTLGDGPSHAPVTRPSLGPNGKSPMTYPQWEAWGNPYEIDA